METVTDYFWGAPKWTGSSLNFQFNGSLLCLLVETFLSLELSQQSTKLQNRKRKCCWWVTRGISEWSSPISIL